ncbi:MAG: hypothetical protein NVSMB6_30080 [Burkholderiaceae bacterium]
MRCSLIRLLFAVLASTALCTGAVRGAYAGTIVVHFVNPSTYTDIGRFDALPADPMGELQRYLVALGKKIIPANQVLTVDFLDIDLAGTGRPLRGSIANVRVIRSAADAPYITLQYRLEENGRLLASGKQDLTDVLFMDRYRGREQQDSYPYEKRLLAQWLRRTVAEAGAPQP